VESSLVEAGASCNPHAHFRVLSLRYLDGALMDLPRDAGRPPKCGAIPGCASSSSVERPVLQVPAGLGGPRLRRVPGDVYRGVEAERLQVLV
jgi:hypothetical protein